MVKKIKWRSDAERVASIVRDAGGEVVGRTRLQKITYLLEVSGLGEGFAFEYRHYGPYSEDLFTATKHADLLGYLKEEEIQASWGGLYSIFTVDKENEVAQDTLDARKEIVQRAAKANSIELELAATAVFLFLEGEKSPWQETANRKPEKTKDGNLKRAKILLENLREIQAPTPLPIFD